MGSFAVKSLLFLLIFGLIASNVVVGSRPMHMKNKNGEEDHEHINKTSTSKHGNQDGSVIGEEDHEHINKTSTSKHGNQDGSVIGEEDHEHINKTSTSKHGNQDGSVIGKKDHEQSIETSTYKNFDQDDAEIRSKLPFGKMVFTNPNKQCYTQFFLGGLQPMGLRTGPSLQNILYICQMSNQQYYFATMFDQSFGIPVFSAYTITPANVIFFPSRTQPGWRQTPGIERQGSNAIYRNRPMDRGHLAPCATLSNTEDSFRSTFVHTNAVPQQPAFNRGRWAQYERRIRVYAEQCTMGPQLGILYLLTGVGFGHIQDNPVGYNPQVQLGQLGPAGNNRVTIPNFLWTAGCCVFQNGNVESFAVVGNNVQYPNQMFTQQITVAQLQHFLAADVVYRHIGRPNIRLFPGNQDASDEKNNKILPRRRKD